MTQNEASATKSKGRQFSCSECGHSNANDATVCTKCGSHLFIKCRKCRTNNQRTHRHCKKCGANLRRSWWSRLRFRWQSGQTQKATWKTLLLTVAFIVAGFGVVILLSNLFAFFLGAWR